MSKAELKVGSAYYSKKNKNITRKITKRTYDDWMNCYFYEYKSSRFKDGGLCSDFNFATWAGGKL